MVSTRRGPAHGGLDNTMVGAARTVTCSRMVPMMSRSLTKRLTCSRSRVAARNKGISSLRRDNVGTCTVYMNMLDVARLTALRRDILFNSVRWRFPVGLEPVQFRPPTAL
jgi:hypothetical protein